MKLLSQLVIVVAALMMGTVAWAGPPFVTDDPEPVELHHWEVYLASQYVKAQDDDLLAGLFHRNTRAAGCEDARQHHDAEAHGEPAT